MSFDFAEWRLARFCGRGTVQFSTLIRSWACPPHLTLWLPGTGPSFRAPGDSSRGPFRASPGHSPLGSAESRCCVTVWPPLRAPWVLALPCASTAVGRGGVRASGPQPLLIRSLTAAQASGSGALGPQATRSPHTVQRRRGLLRDPARPHVGPPACRASALDPRARAQPQVWDGLPRSGPMRVERQGPGAARAVAAERAAP